MIRQRNQAKVKNRLRVSPSSIGESVPKLASSAIVKSIFNKLAQFGQVVAVSLSSWNPDMDKDKKSEKVSMPLLQELVGPM